MKFSIDAGHGSHTPGKRTPHFPDGHFMHEHEFNFAVAERVCDLLEGYKGVEVQKTYEKERDVPLEERTDKANRFGADAFISIHANAYGSSWNDAHGIETYVYSSRPKEALALAEKVQDALVDATGLANRGVKDANFHVLRETKMTAILCECGFMTNRHEAELLESDSYRERCAHAIVKGIVRQYNLEHKENVAPKGKYYKVQVGAFSHKDNAEQLAKRLKEDGYPTYIVFE